MNREEEEMSRSRDAQPVFQKSDSFPDEPDFPVLEPDFEPYVEVGDCVVVGQHPNINRQLWGLRGRVTAKTGELITIAIGDFLTLNIRRLYVTKVRSLLTVRELKDMLCNEDDDAAVSFSFNDLAFYPTGNLNKSVSGKIVTFFEHSNNISSMDK